MRDIVTVEIWLCRACSQHFAMPERADEDDFSCPRCDSEATEFRCVEEVLSHLREVEVER